MIDDADTNNAFTFSLSDPRFEFPRFEFIDQGNGVWELFLKAGEAIPEPEGHEISITYQVNDGVRDAADSGSLTLIVIDTPVEFITLPDEQELIADENDANWQVQVVAESVNNDGVVSPIASYDFVGAHDGFMIDDNGIITPDASTGGLNYEAGSTRTLTIVATDSNMPLPSMNDIPITVTLRNLDEGNAGYEIAELSVGGTDTLEANRITPDPDGIVEGTLRFRWFTTPDRAATKNYLSTDATTSSALDITDLPILVDEIYGVTITYMDAHDVANGETTTFDVIVSPILFSEASYIGSSNEDSTAVALPTVVADVGNAPPASTLTYDFTPHGTSNHLFDIDANSGVITLIGDLDYETAPSHGLGVRATYDNDGDPTTTDDIFTRDVAASIAVNDLNDNAPTFGQLQVAQDPLVRAGLPKTRDTNVEREFVSTPAVGVADFVDADIGVDIINGRGGHDHIVAGLHNDHIFLGGTPGSFETFYHHFGSTPDKWTPIDGIGSGDSLNNFRRGEDTLIFIDTDDTVISLTDFLNSDQLRVAPIIDGRYIVGVEIYFLNEIVVEVYYNEADSYITIRDEDGAYLPAAASFLGPLISTSLLPLSPTFLIPQSYVSGFLTNNHLLLNYFNADADDDYLQIRDEAYLTLVATDVFISESRTSVDAEFANLLAIDGDATEAYRQVRYEIIAGNDNGHFTLDTATGALSVAEGVTLDYDSISSYTLTVTATDDLDADGNPDPTPDDTKDVIITLVDNTDAVLTSIILEDQTPPPTDPDLL